MSLDYVHQLVGLANVAEPFEPPTPSDWSALESDLGVELPEDHKSLVSHLGSGCFGDTLQAHNPGSSGRWVKFSRENLLQHREAVRDLEKRLGVLVFPRPGGMVMFANLDNQYLYFRPLQMASKRLEGLVWLDADTEELRILPFTFSRFLYELYAGILVDPWAEALRTHIWQRGTCAFFTPLRWA